jgi:hypothetical protein
MSSACEPRRVPVPQPPPTLKTINPRDRRDACIDMISVLYHAENAALEAFDRLADPSVVGQCETFIRARAMLVSDEAAHAKDMEEIMRSVGGGEVRPAAAGFDELWDFERSRQKLLYPLLPGEAALFTLVTESLGYAYLFHLAQATADDHMAGLLKSNVADEEKHIEISMEVLRSELAGTSPLAGFDLMLHCGIFLLLGRRAAATMMKILDELGFDSYAIASSSLHFASQVLLQVVQESFPQVPRHRAMDMLSRVAFSRPMMRIFRVSARIPEPPLLWPAIRSLTGFSRKFWRRPAAA